MLSSSGGMGSGNNRGLRAFDVYSKVQDEYRVKTNTGGFISMVALGLMGVLVWSEFTDYLTPRVDDHIGIDTLPEMKLPIQMNITFPHLRCGDVSVDTVDMNGSSQVNVEGELIKQSLNDELEVTSHSDHIPKDGECLECFGAARKCCNTCAELKEAFQEMGWSYSQVMSEAPQCKETEIFM
eukprot:GHVN01051644.1.p2 GENE.GHVN01051644.1~~GHVN01051644.1.p2  ORF type:complete len:182 (+),score=21.09 GHVN01051644.1:1326-1871(+)